MNPKTDALRAMGNPHCNMRHNYQDCCSHRRSWRHREGLLSRLLRPSQILVIRSRRAAHDFFGSSVKAWPMVFLLPGHGFIRHFCLFDQYTVTSPNFTGACLPMPGKVVPLIAAAGLFIAPFLGVGHFIAQAGFFAVFPGFTVFAVSVFSWSSHLPPHLLSSHSYLLCWLPLCAR